MASPEEIERIRERLQRRLGNNQSRGRLIATNEPTPNVDIPTQQQSSGGFGGLIRRLTSPLVDVPELPGGFVGDIIEEGIESTSSPVGLLSAALIPVTGGASLGLRGAAGAGARLATRIGAEAAVGGAAGLASREVSERLPEDTPGALRFAASLGAGVAAGGATAVGIRGLSRGGRAGAQDAAESIAREIPATSEEARTLAEAIGGARVLNRAERAARNRSFRASQATLAEQARTAATVSGDAASGGIAARGATSGMTAQNIRFETPELSPEITKSLFAQINDAPPNVIGLFSKYDAEDGLTKVLAGVVPTNSELKAMEEVFGEGVSAAILAKRGFGHKLMTAINAPRALVASADLSAPLRQGILLIGKPRAFFRSFRQMVRAFGDEDYYEQAMRELTGLTDEAAATRAALRKSAGLEITGGLTNPEELFIGKGFFRGALQQSESARLIGASERAYSLFLNKLRADVFDDFARQLDSAGLSTPDRLKQYAQFLNAATGRGKMPGAIEKGAPLLNAAFFAPRYNISRFMAPTALFTADDVVRQEVAKDLGRFLGAGLAGMTMLKMAGEAGLIPVSIETNPRSTDFGKVRIGPNRYDFWGGYQQIARAFAQTMNGERKTSSGRIVDENRAEVLGRFFQSKLAPTPGLALDLLRGETFIGERLSSDPEDVGEQLRNRLLPLFMQDVEQGFQEGGWRGGASSIPSMFGVGFSSYLSMGEVKDSIAQELFNTSSYRDLTGTQQKVVDQHPRILDKEAEFDQRSGNDFSEAADNISNELVLTQRALVGRLANNQFSSRRDFADAVEEASLRAAVRRDQAVKDFGIESTDPASPLQIALDEWRNLYKLADLTYESGVISGQIDWEKFDELEADLFRTLSPTQVEFIENRRRAEHDPVIQWYYNNKDVIRNSGYYDIVDEEFTRLSSAIKDAFPEVQSYGDLLALESQAQITSDQRLLNRVRRYLNRIDRVASRRKEQLRRKNPKLDRALLENGRTTKLLTAAARNLGESTALDISR